jgi:hypothetical protein
MPLEERIENTACVKGSSSGREFVFLTQLQIPLMQSIGTAWVQTQLLVMGKDANNQYTERSFANFLLVCH